MYKKLPSNPDFNESTPYVQRISDTAFIPFDPANADYQRFKQDIANSVELQDENGNTLTPDEAKAFVATLP